MPECFDLTFFLNSAKAEKEKAKERFLKLLAIREGREEVLNNQYSLFVGKTVIFNVYEYQETDFLEYGIYLEELHFTKKNFEEKINQMLQIVDVCFKQIEAIAFATGIYELTYDNIKGIKHLKDFNAKVFSKFPILFFKKGYEYGFTPNYNYGNVSCVINKGVQNIYSSPIRQLMEDYGMSYEEALKKTDWIQEH